MIREDSIAMYPIRPLESFCFMKIKFYNNLHLGPEVADGGNQRRVRRDVPGSSGITFGSVGGERLRAANTKEPL